ncbi:MAG: mannose-6-phosphate isomerase, class I [Deltaproteobacteria bacterium]|nr:mannose-6-phosphate isomerase, class I [Deltaproteobacteria bacterium]
MDRIVRLKNPVQPYAWGSRTAIQTLLGQPVPSDTPAAELWLGAHPQAPSEVLIKGAWIPLDRVIEDDPVSILGRGVVETYGNRLPFLLKVLAAERPLSIQVHPHSRQAREGFDRENRLGIPLHAPERNYKDPWHKPECLCALTRFEALKGFRPIEEIADFMDRLPLSPLSDALEALVQRPDPSGLKRFFSMLMGMGSEKSAAVADAAVRYAAAEVTKRPEAYWVAELAREYPKDVGVLAPLMFNLIELEPGEAIYIPPGELHAYLHGVGVEVMASSDNVLRGGLTPKHVDVGELLKVIDFAPVPVQPVDIWKGRSGERAYRTPAAEFRLSRLSIAPDMPFAGYENRNVEILLCMEGGATLTDVARSESVFIQKGTSVLVPSSVPRYEIQGSAALYKATV